MNKFIPIQFYIQKIKAYNFSCTLLYYNFNYKLYLIIFQALLNFSCNKYNLNVNSQEMRNLLAEVVNKRSDN